MFRPPLPLPFVFALGVALLAAGVARADDEPLPVGARFAVAIEDGNLDAVKGLVEGGNSPDTPIDYGENRWTPLMKAAWVGDEAIAAYLLEKGAKVNFANDAKETALHQAVARGHVSVVKLLLGQGANVNAADGRDFRPIHTAAAAGHEEVIRALVAAKADLNAEMYGLTPLMFAVASRKPETVLLLLDLGANVNYQSKAGWAGQTALMSAIQQGDAEMVKLLLSRRANPKLAAKDGTTPLAQAKNGDQDDIVALLVAAGAKK